MLQYNYTTTTHAWTSCGLEKWSWDEAVQASGPHRQNTTSSRYVPEHTTDRAIQSSSYKRKHNINLIYFTNSVSILMPRIIFLITRVQLWVNVSRRKLNLGKIIRPLHQAVTLSPLWQIMVGQIEIKQLSQMLQYGFKLQLHNSILSMKTFRETQENNCFLTFDNVTYD